MKIGIYGAGSFGKKLYSVLKNKGIKVDFFIDQYCKKKFIEKVPIYRLKDAPTEATVYISLPEIPYYIPESIIEIIGDRYLFSSKVINTYEFKEVIGFYEWSKEFPEFFEVFLEDEYFWWRKNKKKMLNYKELYKVEDILSDHKSKEELNKLIKFRESFTYEFYPFPSEEVQYFPIDIIPQSLENINFVDVGSFIGDTLLWLFYLYKHKVNSVLSFEPDKKISVF